MKKKAKRAGKEYACAWAFQNKADARIGWMTYRDRESCEMDNDNPEWKPIRVRITPVSPKQKGKR